MQFFTFILYRFRFAVAYRGVRKFLPFNRSWYWFLYFYFDEFPVFVFAVTTLFCFCFTSFIRNNPLRNCNRLFIDDATKCETKWHREIVRQKNCEKSKMKWKRRRIEMVGTRMKNARTKRKLMRMDFERVLVCVCVCCLRRLMSSLVLVVIFGSTVDLVSSVALSAAPLSR